MSEGHRNKGAPEIADRFNDAVNAESSYPKNLGSGLTMHGPGLYSCEVSPVTRAQAAAALKAALEKAGLFSSDLQEKIAALRLPKPVL